MKRSAIHCLGEILSPSSGMTREISPGAYEVHLTQADFDDLLEIYHRISTLYVPEKPE